MSDTQVPEGFLEFHSYAVTVNDHLHTPDPDPDQPRGKTLGLTDAELASIKAETDLWTTGDPANPGVYERHSDPSTKNSVTSKDVRDFIKNYRKIMRPLLGKMSFSLVITNTDRAVLNIAPPVTSHTKPSTPISEYCYAELKPMGGGKVKVRCMAEADASRASKPKNSDGVEYAFRLDLPVIETVVKAGNETASKLKATVLENPDDNTTKGFSSKALFQMEHGADKASYTFHIFARWINTKHPELNGPWTGPFKVPLT